tara:strand:- start:1364 stop:1654 length:291 start_codon:yes stop_codon:yes gene_type:complete
MIININQILSNGEYTALIFFLIIFIIMYFFMIRPQIKKQKKAENYRDSLKKGDKIVTIGGIHGKVLEVSKNTFTIDTGFDRKLKIEKSAVSFTNLK